MKKEDRKDNLIDMPGEDDRDESQLTGRKAAEYNRQHVIRHRKRVRTKILCALGILLAILAVLAVIIVILVNVWRSTGRSGLLQHAQENSPDAARVMQEAADGNTSETSGTQEAEVTYELQEGQIRYNGRTYQYKENLMNILCLGIDSRDGIEKEKTPGTAGQADCVILAVLDDDAKTIQLINISRDSMVPVHVGQKRTTGLAICLRQRQRLELSADGGGSIRTVLRAAYSRLLCIVHEQHRGSERCGRRCYRHCAGGSGRDAAEALYRRNNSDVER